MRKNVLLEKSMVISEKECVLLERSMVISEKVALGSVRKCDKRAMWSGREKERSPSEERWSGREKERSPFERGTVRKIVVISEET